MTGPDGTSDLLPHDAIIQHGLPYSEDIRRNRIGIARWSTLILLMVFRDSKAFEKGLP
jgi:hypothetical protein